jgi:uncharacterized membrane protein
VIILVLGALAALLTFFAHTAWVTEAIKWVENLGLYGYLVFILIFIVISMPFGVGYMLICLGTNKEEEAKEEKKEAGRKQEKGGRRKGGRRKKERSRKQRGEGENKEERGVEEMGERRRATGRGCCSLTLLLFA